VIEYAKQTSDDLGGLNHDRPQGESVGTLELLLPALVRVWREHGFSREEIERAFNGAFQPCEIVDELWTTDEEMNRAAIRSGRTAVGRATTAAQVFGGVTAALGLLLFFLNAIVALAGGPAHTIAWLAPLLLLLGAGFWAIATFIYAGRYRRELKKLRSERTGA